MTAYQIIQQNPDWVKNPRAAKRTIEETASRYVKELGSHTNLIAEDLGALLVYRDAAINPSDDAGDLSQVAIVGNEAIQEGAKRLVRVYNIFIKAIIAELNGRPICSADQVQEWRERYGIKLAGLKGVRQKKSKMFQPIGLDEEMAKNVYRWLFDYGRIDCTEEVFLWYFGDDFSRDNTKQPKAIKWKGHKNELAYFCRQCTTFKDGADHSVKWKTVYQVIFGLSDDDAKRLKGTLNDIKNGKDSYPSYAYAIDELFKISKLCVCNRRTF